jgi:hypothetical protein
MTFYVAISDHGTQNNHIAHNAIFIEAFVLLCRALPSQDLELCLLEWTQETFEAHLRKVASIYPSRPIALPAKKARKLLCVS